MKVAAWSAFALSLCCWPGAACVTAAEEPPQPVTVELIAEHASIQPGGNTRIGVSFEIEPGWHIYAEDPGDAGLPTQITWSGPGIASFSPLPWPTPKQFQDPGDITTYGYTGLVVLPSLMELMDFTKQIEGAYDLPVPGEVEISAHVNWLACKQLCVPGSADLSKKVPVDYSGEPPQLSPHAPLFEQTE